MTQPDSLFSASMDEARPLAERMRPRAIGEMVGQKRLLAEGTALRRAIEAGHIHSMVLWGPPGCGKTTLALLLARYADAEFISISAVMSGLPEVRKVLQEADVRFQSGRRTVLFVDEVHRFNKIQQDAFLPFIERGSIIFIGATTENPSFELNSALLSRCRVHVMESLSIEDIVIALQHALEDTDHGLGNVGLQVTDDRLNDIAIAADGDVRRALTLLEIASSIAAEEGVSSPPPLWNKPWLIGLADSTSAANSFTTRYRHCTKMFAVQIQTAPYIGSRACLMAVAIQFILRVA